MWYPPPPAPSVYELRSVTNDEGLSVRPMGHLIPFDLVWLNLSDTNQSFRDEPVYIDSGRKRVTIRQPTTYGVSPCQNCGTSYPFGTRKCSCCGVHLKINNRLSVSENVKQLEHLPNCVNEELNVMTRQSDITKQNIHLGCMQNTMENTGGTQRYYHKSPAAHPPSFSKVMSPQTKSLWGKEENTKCFKPSAAQASFSLDMELDIQSQVQRNDYPQNYQDHTYKADEDNYNLDQEEMPPEYYSFSSSSLDHNIWNYDSRSTEANCMDSITATKGSTELSGELSETTNATAENSTLTAHEDLQKKHNLNEQQIEELNVGSSLKPKCSAPVFVDQIVDACGDFRACFTSTCATEVGQLFQVKNVATDTDLLVVSHEKATQTVQMVTSNKNTITEVYMSDLDDLTEEFIKLKDMEKELKRLKSRQASPDGDHCSRVCDCDCVQQLRRAELRLLAFQFFMCYQHCWRCHFTSPLGESAYERIDALPDSIVNTLKTLQKDYNEMRRQILEGASLDDLKPLSINTQNITTGTNYSPASVLEAHLNSFDSVVRSTIVNARSGHGVDDTCNGSRTQPCDDTEAAMDKAKDEGNRRVKTLVLTHSPPGASSETNPGAIKDLNVSDAWFDAEEELGFPNQDEKMEKQNKQEGRKRTDEDGSKLSSLLRITCLPDGVTENDLLIWFEKYNATNVCISSFSNNMRAAVIYIKNPSDAKAAVKDLNGRSLRGHTVQVVQICGPADPKPNDQSHSTLKTHEAETAEDGLGTKNVAFNPSHGGPRCSVDRLTNVCDLPTASGTCVPQHYATMGSFDTIMARLLECHPNISRQRIIDALLELRAKHQGFLSGLPLRSIVEMTSELLTQASTATHI